MASGWVYGGFRASLRIGSTTDFGLASGGQRKQGSSAAVASLLSGMFELGRAGMGQDSAEGGLRLLNGGL